MPRDEKRIEPFLEKLKELWEIYPDWRFGQIVVNVLGRDPFYIEDDRAIVALQQFIDQHR